MHVGVAISNASLQQTDRQRFYIFSQSARLHRHASKGWLTIVSIADLNLDLAAKQQGRPNATTDGISCW